MKVSIIVPVYNVENYLSKCLDSLVNQTLQDVEILVINDGSTDDSQQIINTFQEKYPTKIMGFQKQNGGLSDARNFGIERAVGEYIGFVDGDDYVGSTMYEEMYHLAKKHNADMVICNLQKVNENGNKGQKLHQLPNFLECFSTTEGINAFAELGYFACNKIFRKELFNQKRFKRGIHFEDIELIPKLFLDSQRIAHTQNFHYFYLERQGSISKQHGIKGLDLLKAVESVQEYFLQSPYKREDKALRGFLILQGIYSFLAFMAFAKDKAIYQILENNLQKFIRKNDIQRKEILGYSRFGQNYLLSLPIKKILYYLLYFLGQKRLIRIILNR